MNSAATVRIEYRRLSSLLPAHRNPKRHDIATIIASIQRFGFVSPLIEDAETGHLVAGHGRLEALLQMQKRQTSVPQGIQVVQSGDWCVPVVCGKAFASEREAEAYLLADNRLVEIGGGWEDAILLTMLKALQEDHALVGIGYTDDDLTRICAEVSPSFEPVGIEQQGRLDQKATVECPACGHTFVPKN